MRAEAASVLATFVRTTAKARDAILRALAATVQCDSEGGFFSSRTYRAELVEHPFPAHEKSAPLRHLSDQNSSPELAGPRLKVAYTFRCTI